MDVVSAVLEKAAKEAENFKTTKVKKHLDLEYDLAALLAIDTNELNVELLRKAKNEYLKDLARDNTQLLINKIWELPTKRVDESVVATLPKSSYVLPREKPIPKARSLTKWQKFALEKGIKKTKKGRLLWDNALQKWVPRYGYKKAAAEKEKNWMYEVTQNDNPMENPFAKKKGEKQEKVSKNEFQRLKNLASAKKVKIPRMGLLTPENLSTSQLAKAATISRVSTASLGKFQPRLPKEKEAKNVGALLPTHRKRKAPPMTPKQERTTSLNVIDGILKKRPKLDIDKAVNKQIFQEQQQRAQEKQNETSKRKGSGRKRGKGSGKGKGQGKVRKKSGRKPPAGKGNRNPRKTNGRKRR